MAQATLIPNETAKPAKPAKKPNAKKPYVSTEGLSIADFVFWHPAGETRNGSLPALIIQVRGPTTLCLRVFGENGDDAKDAVKHSDDPTLTKRHRVSSGTWTRRDAED